MTPTRRRLLQLSGALVAMPSISTGALALDYPTRPVKIVVPVPPGGALDLVARLIGQKISESLGQPFVIENRPGAATNIGVDAVVRSPPDGYTLLLVPGSVAVNATLYTNLQFDFQRDIAPVAMLSGLPLVMEVNLAVPARTVPEFIAYAKANAGKVSMATSGVGTPQHIAGEMFKQMTGIEMTPVPFGGGGPALVSLMGEQVQVMFSPLPESIGTIKDGKLRALAVTTAKRLDALPNVPTVAESVPGFEATSWQGLGAPKGTPPEIIDKLNKAVNAALADPATKSRLLELGGLPDPMSPKEFEAHIAMETEKWGKVVRAANLKAE
jgi:tripartite-type tricarboxylate transporter receptor subunit TctC